MYVDVLVAEIGSTTTVVNAFTDLKGESPRFLGQGFSPTTVESGDVREGLRGAIASLEDNLEVEALEWGEMLACSSAAGGLRMTVHGLVYDMTVKAANEAALGAGAVVKKVTAGELTDSDLKKIREINPNIILLAGGVDYGERATALSNAKKIKALDLGVPVIYAGNVANQEEIEAIFEDDVYLVENVYPRIDQLNVEPTRRAIQTVFEQHIIKAPGMGGVRDLVSGEIRPTPGAVMRAAQGLYEIVDDLMAFDVGGATTDVHSVTEGSDEISRLLIAPEPVAKRTVEGDLGVFVNAQNLISRIGSDILRTELEISEENWDEEIPKIPKEEHHKRLIARLGCEAVRLALSRHAGKTRYLYGPSGRTTIAEGKDLTDVKWVIGTGGVLTQLSVGRQILETTMRKNNPMALYPKEFEIIIDRDYIMAACGMLFPRYAEGAAKILAASLDLPEAVGGEIE